MFDENYYPDISSMEKNRDVEGLIKALEHEDHLIRKDAAISLKKVGDWRAIKPLIRSLKYEGWQSENPVLSMVRECSAEALGIIGDSRAVKPLIKAIKEDTDDTVRWKSILALGNIGDESAIIALIEALKSDSWIVRENAAKALGSIGAEEGVEPLINALEDKDWRVRKNVVISLGKIGDEKIAWEKLKVINALLNLLNDEDEDVRRKTIKILEKMGDAAFKPLLNLFMEGKDWYTRSKAAKVLGNIGDKRAVDPFINTLSNKRKEDRNRYIRGRVSEALGKLGDERAVDVLLEAINDDTLYVRQKAEEAIINIRTSAYTGEFTQFNNGSISFNYPRSWTFKTIVTDEKYDGHNADHSIKLSIYKKSELEDITFKDLIKIWEDIFEYRNIKMTYKKTIKQGNMEIFYITGNNFETNNEVIVVGFMLYELFYYLNFTIKPDISEDDEKDIDLITNTFRIHLNYY